MKASINNCTRIFSLGSSPSVVKDLTSLDSIGAPVASSSTSSDIKNGSRRLNRLHHAERSRAIKSVLLGLANSGEIGLHDVGRQHGEPGPDRVGGVVFWERAEEEGAEHRACTWITGIA